VKYNTPLWKFYKDDEDVCHYLFGTMHVSNEDAYSFSDLAKKYIDKSTLYAAEMDLEVAAQNNVMEYFKLPEDTDLKKMIGEKKFGKWQKILLKSFGINLEDYLSFSPFFISTLLSEAVLYSYHQMALDHYLWQYALGNGKQMTGVETFEQQLKTLQSISLEIQVKSLKDICKNVNSFKNKISKLSLQYANGDLRGLYQSSKKQIGPLRKLMLYDRNKVMANSIIEKSKYQTSFFAIGAAHLFGNKGVIKYLKNQGFSVKPVFS